MEAPFRTWIALAGLLLPHTTLASPLPPDVQALIDACGNEFTRASVAADGKTHIESTRFHSNRLKPNVTCGLNTRLSRNGDGDDIESRTLALNSQGLFQVIVADETVPGPLSKVTGTHTFYLLPGQPGRIVPEASMDDGTGAFRITATNGETFVLNSGNGRLEGYTGGSVREDEAISLGPTGGITFDSIRSGLLLDCGWRTGNVATTRPNGACQVRDSKGQSCSVPNSLLFRYTRVGGAKSGPIDEVIPLFETSEAMDGILKQVPSCTGLDPEWAKPQTRESTPETPCEPQHSPPQVTRETQTLPALIGAIAGTPAPSP